MKKQSSYLDLVFELIMNWSTLFCGIIPRMDSVFLFIFFWGGGSLNTCINFTGGKPTRDFNNSLNWLHFFLSVESTDRKINLFDYVLYRISLFSLPT